MLIVEQNKANKIGLTLKEKQTLENPNYLFEFYNIEQDKSFLVYLTIQNNSNRFELFILTLPTDIDLPTGSFLYKVFESSNTELETEDKLLLERGRMNVLKDFPEEEYYTLNTTNQVNYVE